MRKLSKKLGVGVSLRSEEYGTHTAEVESRTRESFTRHRALRKRLSVCNVDRQLEKESNRLQHWVSEEDKSAYEKEVAKKKSTLKGAARPAREVYPWLYPSGKGTGNGVQPPAERNLLEEFKGNLAGHEETRLYLLLHYERASRLMENMEVEQAYRLFQGVEEMDRSGSLAGLITQKIVQGFIEKGDLLEAREMLEGRKKWRTASPFLAWDLVLVEYISRHVLKETESSEALEVALKEAMRVEPGIGHILAKHESYEEHVAMYAAQDEKEVELQIKESFLRSGKVPSFHVLDTPVWSSLMCCILYTVYCRL